MRNGRRRGKGYQGRARQCRIYAVLNRDVEFRKRFAAVSKEQLRSGAIEIEEAHLERVRVHLADGRAGGRGPRPRAEVRGDATGLELGDEASERPQERRRTMDGRGEAPEALTIAGLSSASTDGAGHFTIRGLPDGGYRVRASRRSSGFDYYECGQNGVAAKTGERMVGVDVDDPNVTLQETIALADIDSTDGGGLGVFLASTHEDGTFNLTNYTNTNGTAGPTEGRLQFNDIEGDITIATADITGGTGYALAFLNVDNTSAVFSEFKTACRARLEECQEELSEQFFCFEGELGVLTDSAIREIRACLDEPCVEIRGCMDQPAYAHHCKG